MHSCGTRRVVGGMSMIEYAREASPRNSPSLRAKVVTCRIFDLGDGCPGSGTNLGDGCPGNGTNLGEGDPDSGTNLDHYVARRD